MGRREGYFKEKRDGRCTQIVGNSFLKTTKRFSNHQIVYNVWTNPFGIQYKMMTFQRRDQRVLYILRAMIFFHKVQNMSMTTCQWIAHGTRWIDILNHAVLKGVIIMEAQLEFAENIDDISPDFKKFLYNLVLGSFYTYNSY